MSVSFVRDATNAVLTLLDRGGFSYEFCFEKLRGTLDFNPDSANAMFGAQSRLANAARFLADQPKALLDQSDSPLHQALYSTAFLGYKHCLATNQNFRNSFEAMEGVLSPSGPLPEGAILEIFADVVLRPSVAQVVTAPSADPAVGDGQITGTAAELGAAMVDVPVRAGRHLFSAPLAKSLRERFEELLSRFPTLPGGEDNARQQCSLDRFRESLDEIVAVADTGRTFTEFALLQEDLDQIRPRLLQLEQPDNPLTIRDRANQSRRLAESINYARASPEDYVHARSAWLLSAFWNSQLTCFWPSNSPYVVYDFLGYMTTLQASLRYSDKDFLLLLRVGFSICRVASDDRLIPYQFFSSDGERLPDWIKHTVGTILATTGPGRVPPSRVAYDVRLGEEDREDHARTLLRLWTSDSDRAAATTLLLEMGAWDRMRANRLLAQVFPAGAPELEIWRAAIDSTESRSKCVRVIRPNPWAPSTKKRITVENEAVAILASDVVGRCYEGLGGDISLIGHDFHERRVPTYVCSAEFGPLGLFKLDLADRIVREVHNFARYAQRLHPRYRAGRCDKSEAVVSEPDEGKQFIQGALTSYVFTEDETPKTLAAWFADAPHDRASALCEELFERALRPWYRHAVSATIDMFAEFPIYKEAAALERLVRECREYHSIDIRPNGADSGLGTPVSWISSLLEYLQGRGNIDERCARTAAEMQILRSYRAICHGDLHLDNVLVVGKAGAEYPCIIDFEATHEGHILKDFGRFVASTLCRPFSWVKEDAKTLVEVLPSLLLDWPKQPDVNELPANVLKVVCAITAARAGFVRAWQAGSFPSKLELVATLVASLLPFARYRDTPICNVRLALELSSCLVAALAKED